MFGTKWVQIGHKTTVTWTHSVSQSKVYNLWCCAFPGVVKGTAFLLPAVLPVPPLASPLVVPELQKDGNNSNPPSEECSQRKSALSASLGCPSNLPPLHLPSGSVFIRSLLLHMILKATSPYAGLLPANIKRKFTCYLIYITLMVFCNIYLSVLLWHFICLSFVFSMYWYYQGLLYQHYPLSIN